MNFRIDVISEQSTNFIEQEIIVSYNKTDNTLPLTECFNQNWLF